MGLMQAPALGNETIEHGNSPDKLLDVRILPSERDKRHETPGPPHRPVDAVAAGDF